MPVFLIQGLGTNASPKKPQERWGWGDRVQGKSGRQQHVVEAARGAGSTGRGAAAPQLLSGSCSGRSLFS